MNTDFLLELGQLEQGNVKTLAASFDNLPPNPYVDGAFRLRRYSHFTFDGAQLNRLPTKAFVQDDSINTYQGNVERTYPEIEDQICKSQAFTEMFNRFKEITNLDDETPIEVHQMRILAKHKQTTEPAPEGVHQDGFDRLGVFVIERNNVAGGEIQVHTDKQSAPFVSHNFDQGEFVILNDQKFFHSAAAMKPSTDDDGYMDVFVLTA